MDREIRNAYFAGLIDGEGSIGIQSNGRGLTRFEIKVDMTCRRTIAALQDHFCAGSVRPKKSRPGCKPQWRWRVTHAAARKVLAQVAPYLITKAFIVDGQKKRAAR